jgi:hypothetical protein
MSPATDLGGPAGRVGVKRLSAKADNPREYRARYERTSPLSRDCAP